MRFDSVLGLMVATVFLLVHGVNGETSGIDPDKKAAAAAVRNIIEGSVNEQLMKVAKEMLNIDTRGLYRLAQDVQRLSFSTFDDLTSDAQTAIGNDAWFVKFYHTGCSHCMRARIPFAEASKTFASDAGVHFGVIDVEKDWQLKRRFFVQVQDEPEIWLIHKGEMHEFPMLVERTEENFAAFVKLVIKTARDPTLPAVEAFKGHSIRRHSYIPRWTGISREPQNTIERMERLAGMPIERALIVFASSAAFTWAIIYWCMWPEGTMEELLEAHGLGDAKIEGDKANGGKRKAAESKKDR